MRDYLGRVIYCAILGYDVSFSYIHAVKLAQQGKGFEKRMGYLSSSILLNDRHELIVLLINTIQKDLTSSNLLDNCIALTATCQLVNSEMIPVLLQFVLKKLKHPRELVRLKAVVCLHRFLVQAPDIVQHILPEFEIILCDKEPGVMAATVNVFHHLIKTDPEKYISVAEKMIMIMQQILSRKMPVIFEYHTIPFPWLQIKILQCLAWIGAKVHSISQLMIPLLKEVLQRTNMKESLAFGILYECILCITSIKPDQSLLAEAATHVGRFLHSHNPSLKYIGVKCLTALVKVDAKFALDYQALVVESLEDGDEAVQRKMIELLYQMCNISNVQFICAKLLEHLQATADQFWQSHILNMVTLLAEKFKVSDQWYIDTMFQTVELCSKRTGQGFVNSIITVIQSGSKADGQGRNDLQQFLIKKSIQYLLKENTCQELIQISAWVLGEFASSLKNMPAEKLTQLIIKHLSDPDIDVQVKGWLITAFTKLYEAKVLSKDMTLSKTEEVIQCNSSSIIKQRLTLLHQLAKHDIYAEVPVPNESVVVNQLDFTLSFLDDFVNNALEAGMTPYKPLHLRFPAPIQTQEVQKLFIGVLDRSTPAVPSTHSSLTPDSLYKSGSHFSGEVKMNIVKRVWGKEGLIKEYASKQDTAKTENQSVLDLDMVSEVDDMERRRQEVISSLFNGITPA
ncbi:hypothetical protein ACJMK2_027093 [Sinanodonta woodiana]|uniref:Clathrin/coatomer adaptor adaptin-like N-terminal domain-containing protein n=1 Tax=Sinanodonta woodiana TaxID=1069815 RepID=A0ABD3XQ80_SINWO